jgi:trigger factor
VIKLQIQEKKLENATIEMKIDVPSSRVDVEFKNVFDSFARTAKVHGFRKGKVPLNVIEQKFKDEIEKEVLENIVRESYVDAVTEKKHLPIGNPTFDFDKIRKGEDFSFSVKFEVTPTVEMAEYKGVGAEERACEVTDADIAKELESIRERNSKISKKPDDGLTENTDMVKIQIKRIDNVDPSAIENVEYREYSIVLGKSKDEYAFDKHLIGMKAGDEREVEIDYPADYEFKEIAGKKVKYLIKAVEISRVELPALDDEFAKDMGEFATIDDLKKNVREYLEGYARSISKRESVEKLLREIIEKSSFDIPLSMIEREKELIFKKIQDRMGLQTGNPDEFAASIGINPDDLKAKLLEEGTYGVKSVIVRSEVGKKENITCTDEDFDNIVKALSDRNKMTPEQTRDIITERDLRENIEAEAIMEKAADFIYNNAKIKKLKAVPFDEFVKKEQE